MIKIEKVLVVLCLIMCIGLPLFSAGQRDVVESGKVKLTFMGWGTDAEVATYQTMIDDFEKAYPNVEVEYIVVADNEFDTKLQTMIGAGTPDRKSVV